MAPLWPVLALLALLLLLYRRLRFVSLFRFPGPRALPLLGNSLSLLGSQADFFKLCQQLGKKHPGGVFQLWVGLRPFVFIYKSSIIKPLLTSSYHLEKNFEYSLTEDWLGNGLITSKDENWLHQRKLLTPCFHFEILKEFPAPVWRHGRVLIDKLRARGSAPLDFLPLAKLLALDIICETAMGVDINTQANSDFVYPAAISRMTDILCHRFITPWIKPRLMFRLSPSGREYYKLLSQVQRFVQQIIKKRKQELFYTNLMQVQAEQSQLDMVEVNRTCVNSLGDTEEILEKEHEPDFCKDCNLPAHEEYLNNNKPKTRLALLDFLLKMSREDSSFTDKEVTDQVNTFMFAGHDTISSAISFTLFALGHHPEWQDAIVVEVSHKCPNFRNQEPEARDILNGTPVLDRCIREALRLYPSSPMIGRTIHTPLQTPDGTLPSHTTAVIHSFLLHRDEAMFPNPDIFDPDRFLPDNCSRDPFAFIPFSAGPRNCIGKTLAQLEMKIIIALILTSFRVKSVQSEDQLELAFEVVLTSKSGIHLQFTPRD